MSDSEDSDFDVTAFVSSDNDDDQFEEGSEDSDDANEPPPAKRLKATSSPVTWVVVLNK